MDDVLVCVCGFLALNYGGFLVLQALKSAAANAENNHGMDGTRLVVSRAIVGRSTPLKRVRFHGKGRMGRKERPRTHLTIMVKEAVRFPSASPIIALDGLLTVVCCCFVAFYRAAAGRDARCGHGLAWPCPPGGAAGQLRRADRIDEWTETSQSLCCLRTMEPGADVWVLDDKCGFLKGTLVEMLPYEPGSRPSSSPSIKANLSPRNSPASARVRLLPTDDDDDDEAELREVTLPAASLFPEPSLDPDLDNLSNLVTVRRGRLANAPIAAARLPLLPPDRPLLSRSAASAASFFLFSPPTSSPRSLSSPPCPRLTRRRSSLRSSSGSTTTRCTRALAMC